MQIDKSGTLSRSQNSIPGEAISSKGDASKEVTQNQNNAPGTSNGSAPALQEATKSSNQGPPAAPGRVNDVFWEQFLTERPGSSDTEEASSSLRTEPSDDPREERNPGSDSMWKNRKDMEQLTL